MSTSQRNHKRPGRRFLVAASLICLGISLGISVLLAACGGGGGNSKTLPTQMATPVISPVSSTQTACSVNVSMSDATAGATINFTTDGSMPTAASLAYSKPFLVSCPKTTNKVVVQAFAPAINSANYVDSSVASATFTFQVPTPAPTITPAAGNIVSGSLITLADATPGALIYYTIDGSTPTAKSALYTVPFKVTGTGALTVKAFALALNQNYVDSAVASTAYTIAQNPTITVGTMSGPVKLNMADVALPVTTTDCVSMKSTVTPAFPVPPSTGGVLGSVTFPKPCQPHFAPGSTMPDASAQYTITLTAIGQDGTTPASADLVVKLTTPAIKMDPTKPVTPTLPAGSGSATEFFFGSGCTFTSYNGASGASDYWSGTLNGDGTPVDAESGIIVTYTDCNHVAIETGYSGESAGSFFYTYLYNPPPGGGLSERMTITFVSTSNSSAFATLADGTTATLKSQSTIGHLDAEGNIAKVEKSAPGEITFGNVVVPSGDIHQLISCGAKTMNFCGLGKTQLTVFTANGFATHSYALPENASFAVANSTGTYVFSNSGHLYSLDEAKGFNLMEGFISNQKVTAAAVSGNRIAALTSDGHLQLFDTDSNNRVGSYETSPEQDNIAFTKGGEVLFGKLGSAKLYVLDRSGTISSYELPETLLTLVQNEGAEALASLATGDIVSVDSLGNTELRARAAKPEDLYAGFRILGKTLVFAPADNTGTRRLSTLAVDVQ